MGKMKELSISDLLEMDAERVTEILLDPSTVPSREQGKLGVWALEPADE